jgi:hypothetical protein
MRTDPNFEPHRRVVGNEHIRSEPESVLVCDRARQNRDLKVWVVPVAREDVGDDSSDSRLEWSNGWMEAACALGEQAHRVPKFKSLGEDCYAYTVRWSGYTYVHEFCHDWCVVHLLVWPIVRVPLDRHSPSRLYKPASESRLTELCGFSGESKQTGGLATAVSMRCEDDRDGRTAATRRLCGGSMMVQAQSLVEPYTASVKELV